MIERPKKVARSEKQIFTNEQYQQYAEEQFNNIYDFLDTSVENIEMEALIGNLVGKVILIKTGNVCEVRVRIDIPDVSKYGTDFWNAGLFFNKRIDLKYAPAGIDESIQQNNLTIPRAYLKDPGGRITDDLGLIGIFKEGGYIVITLFYENVDKLVQAYTSAGETSATIVGYYTYITK